MSLGHVRTLFALAGVYDLGLGVAFALFGPQIYATLNVTPPNHWGYVQFGALMLAIFGGMFFAVAADPVRNRNLIPYGMALKLAYAGVVAYYWADGSCDNLFKPFAVIDAVMLILFLAAYRRASREVTPPVGGLS